MALRWLILSQIVLFFGSFLAGNIPLSLSLSDSKLRILSTHGAGLMVGTALNVILPEGVAVLYRYTFIVCKADFVSVKSTSGHNHRRSMIKRQDEHSDEEDEETPTPSKPINKPVVSSKPVVDKPTTEPEKHSGKHSDSTVSDEAASFEPHKHIGPPLALGFALMLLIDQLFQTHPSSSPSSNMVQMSDFRTTASSPLTTQPGPRIVSTTFGLCVHAMADGIAMGAAAASNRGSLELLVFLAIMLHKAPSAFGLVTFLLHEGATRRTVKQHLVVFSLSAPLGAILTYFALVSPSGPLVRGGGLAGATNAMDLANAAFQMTKWTGILLLFSAGTFLYVSLVHILPEVVSHDHSSESNGSLDNPAQKGPREPSPASHGKLSFTQLLALLLGLALPYFLTIEHSH
jgi:zinc transporter 9